MKNLLYLIKILLIILFVLVAVGCGDGGSGTIFDAARNGDIETVKTMLDKDPGAINRREEVEPRTARAMLHSWAKGKGRKGREKIKQLLSEKGLVGDSLLHLAAKNGHTELVTELINRGADIDARTFVVTGVTPLSYAAEAGRVETMKLLFQKGALIDPPKTGKNIYSYALFRTAYNGHTEALKLLLEKGAKLANRQSLMEHFLLSIVYRGHQDTLELLLDRVESMEPGGGFKLDTLLNHPTQKRSTLLYYALLAEQFQIAELLIKKGAGVNRTGKNLKTSLFASSYWDKDFPHSTGMLLDKGATPNARDRYGRCALHVLADKGFTASARLLLKNGARLDFTASNGLTPLDSAMLSHQRGIVRLFLSLHFAAADGDTRTLESLIKDYPQLVNSTDMNGKTPLHYAAKNNRLKAAKLLLEAGADAGIRSMFKHVPLLNNAVSRLMVPHPGCVKKYRYKKTPREMALEYGHTQMAGLLESHVTGK
ncbi:MAG: hypothetical protein GY940_45290 [bacterium]|nr:hypothetical protein [bacterium]